MVIRGVKVTGARDLRRELRNAGPELKKQLRTAYRSSASIVSIEARKQAPIRSGDLRDSIRPLGGVSKATVAAGKGATRNYAGVIHYGFPGRGIKPQEFLHTALEKEWPRVYGHFEAAVEAVVDQVNGNRLR